MRGAIGAGAAARLPDQRQIAGGRRWGQHRIQGQQAPLTGQVGGKEGVEVHHIGRRAGKHRRQQLALHRAPGHIGPHHVVAGVLALPGGDHPLDVAIEFGRQIQGPELDLLRLWLGRPAAGQQQGEASGSTCQPTAPRQQMRHGHQPRSDATWRQRNNNNEQIIGASSAVSRVCAKRM